MVDVPKKRGRPAGVKSVPAKSPTVPVGTPKATPAGKAVAAPKPVAPRKAAVAPVPAPLPVAVVKPVVAAPVPAEPIPALVPKPVPDITKTKSESVTQTELAATPMDLEGTKLMNEILENSKKFAEDAKVRFQGAFSEMSEKAKAGVEKSTKAVEEFGDLAKGNVEALVESGKIAAKGIETMGQDAAEYSRMTFEKATAAMKSIAQVKTPAEFFQLQSELLSSTFDAFAKETAKNSEALIKLAGDVAQPLSTRVSIVTEKVKSLAA